LSQLFDDKEVVKSGRLTLSRLTVEAVDTMAGWLEGALAPDWSLAELERVVEAGEGVLISDLDAQPIGAAVVRRNAPTEEAVAVPFIAVAPGRRFRGLGGEAGLALERHLRRRLGIEKVYAPVPEQRGLAVYFWMRLGYRPLMAGESAWPLAGLNDVARAGIWLVRYAA
jgi:GNAT superfamily N-acetyltransferase